MFQFRTAQIWAQALRLQAAGTSYAVATVVRRQPPVSTHVGDKAIITADGSMVGWVGGACSHDLVRRQALAALADGRPRMVQLRVLEDGSTGETGAGGGGEVTVNVTCPSGGEVDVYVEPHLRPPRLVVFGEVPLARTLADMGTMAGFDTVLVKAGEEPGAAQELYVVAASMGHYDDDALAYALDAGASYAGLVASRRRGAAVLALLRARGYDDQRLERIKTPAGLDIHAVTQEEIALSILAEIVAHRRTTQAPVEVGGFSRAIEPATARDPVCGMEVSIAFATHTMEHAGQTYYFCCPHCKAAFARNPEAHLAAGGSR